MIFNTKRRSSEIHFITALLHYISQSTFHYYSARFLFGGEQGRLKYAPPDQFSPIYESLLPTQTLCIDPGFYFGELHKVILSGPLPTEDDVAFVPNPVDTTNVSKKRCLILMCSFKSNRCYSNCKRIVSLHN